MQAVIFDVDGTLANLDHRVHYVSNGVSDWKNFFKYISKDTVYEPVRLINHALHEYIKSFGTLAILVVSARGDDLKQETEDWLRKNHIQYDRIYMRKAGDYRKDSIVKKEILERIQIDGFEPVLAIDDRKQVVDMWREHGIMTFQCQADESVSQRPAYPGEQLFTMLVGPVGAGKSTYCETYLKGQHIISSDKIREEMFGYQEGGHDAVGLQRTWSYIHDYIKNRVEHGLPVVLDATNIKRKDRMAVMKLIPECQQVKYIVVDRPLEEKLRTRGHRSEELIRRHHNTFKSNKKDILSGDDLPNVIVLDATFDGIKEKLIKELKENGC